MHESGQRPSQMMEVNNDFEVTWVARSCTASPDSASGSSRVCMISDGMKLIRPCSKGQGDADTPSAERPSFTMAKLRRARLGFASQARSSQVPEYRATRFPSILVLLLSLISCPFSCFRTSDSVHDCQCHCGLCQRWQRNYRGTSGH
jgi:hypothetical protein